MRRRALLLGALPLLSLPAAPGAARPLGLRDALRLRRPLMIVVAPPDRALPGSEAVGDWAHEFENALRTLPREVTAARLTREGFRDAFAAPALRGAFATLFLRPDREGLLHEGPILDPPTYGVGLGFLAGAAPPGPGTGLLPVRARLR